MREQFREAILRSLGASEMEERETIQSLWSGYGKISRYAVSGGEVASVVVKEIRFPSEADHPRGWNTDFSHRRKLRSYEVEARWYAEFANRCSEECRVPRFFGAAREGEEMAICLEDLDAAGFVVRRRQVSESEFYACIDWLAHFHARFLGERLEGLWEQGTYWHLNTRPDELEALEDQELKEAAGAIDAKLKGCRFQTVVHGDAKLANFCFSADGKRVAAVDFQYVGGGCGMKDLTYFVGSCFGEEDCERVEEKVLERYFDSLRVGLELCGKNLDTAAIEAEWRELYPVAWTDFHRFLKGWSPGHWKLHDYSERVARSVVESIREERAD